MTPAQVQQIIRQIEHANHLAATTDNLVERDRLHAEVRRMWLTVKPFVVTKKAVSVAR